MKKLSFLVLGTSILLLGACSKEKVDSTNESSTSSSSIVSTASSSSTSQAASQSSEKESEVTSADLASLTEHRAEEMAALIDPSVKTQRIGDKERGYVDIPESWIPFQDLNGSHALQYCDGTDVNIITLDHLTAEQLGVASLDEVDIKQVVNVLHQTYSQNEAVDTYKISYTSVDKNLTYNYIMQMKTGKYFVIWLFQTDQKELHLISAEGTKDNVNALIFYIEGTWKPDK